MRGNICFDFFFSLRNHNIYILVVTRRFKRDLARVIYITLDVTEFLNIRIFNWYKAPYWASSSTFGILILQGSSMALISFPHGVFVKTDSSVSINTWNTEFYIPLSLRQNEWRYKIWHWLELSWFCKWKQSTNKEI